MGEIIIRVAICEDNKIDWMHLTDCLEKEFRKRRLLAEVFNYESGEALLAAADDRMFQVYFLDIYMQGMSGIDVAKVLRNMNQNVPIVFTTSSAEFYAEGFAVDAEHYLVKPFRIEDVSEALERCLRKSKEIERYVELTINRATRRILLSDVMWIESKDRICYLHLIQGEQKVYLKLDEMERLLNDARFLRCHLSFLINMDAVDSEENKFFIMTDGKRIPLRQAERARIRAEYEYYLFEKMRRGK